MALTDTPARPPRKLLRRLWRASLLLLFVTFAAFNAMAYMQARALTHYDTTLNGWHKHPERMTAWEKARILTCGLPVPRPRNHSTPRDCGMQFTVEKFPGAHGLTLEAWRIPGQENAPVVLMFPGYAAPKDMQLAPARVLHSMGCETWLVDFHGSGGSSGDSTTIGFDEADDVAAAVRVAQSKMSGSHQIVLFGTSMGAAAILRAVYTGSVKVDGLILECPFDRLSATVGNRFRLMGLPSFPLTQTLLFWGGIQQGFNPFVHNPVEYARSVRCPTLLMQGDQDQRVGLAHAKAVARALGDRGHFEVFQGLGHMGYSQRGADQWRSAVKEFLLRSSRREETLSKSIANTL